MLKQITILCCLLYTTLAGVVVEEEYSTPPPPPRPYAFGYAAGRFPGHIDRTHSEVSDGSGVVQGSYSYIDPSFQIRKVDYVADHNGFHPTLNRNAPSLPKDTPVVAAAKEKHLIQYSKIADAHQHAPPQGVVLRETQAVQYAKNKHFSLYQKISEEHARIAAEREAQRLAYEAEHPNSLEH